MTAPISGSPLIRIIGAGADTTLIDGNQLDRVFNIGSGRTASISGVTIRKGNETASNWGGGILNEGTLSISHSTLSANQAFGGGGLFNGNRTTVSQSTFSGNSATHGGGMDNSSGSRLYTEPRSAGTPRPQAAAASITVTGR